MNSDNEFFNKNIVVTGASSGIGQSVAIYFLNCGANVVLAGRDVETMNSFCKRNNFQNATIMKLDLKEDIQIYDLKSSPNGKRHLGHRPPFRNTFGVMVKV